MKGKATYYAKGKEKIMRLEYKDKLKTKVYISKSGLSISWNKKLNRINFSEDDIKLLMMALRKCSSQWNRLLRKERKR